VEKKENTAKTRFQMTKKRHSETLEKAIKEKKADSEFMGLCRAIAKTKNFFTSSCCSGRIMLLELQPGETKKDARFHKKWHCTVKTKEVWNALNETSSGELWLRMEPLILHIGADSLENANKILDVMKKAGVKRGGLIVAKPGKFLLELEGTQRMSLPVKSGKKILVEKDFLELLVKKANEKMKKNKKTIKRLEKEIIKAVK